MSLNIKLGAMTVWRKQETSHVNIDNVDELMLSNSA
jgi:hypothetical protein